MSNLVIRNYKPEDLLDVVKLYSSSQVKSPFFLRDKDYFDYFTSYPGVKEDSIFIAASERGVEGVAIIAVVQESYTLGKIIELWANEVASGDALLQRSVEYCRDNNIDAVEVSPPTFLDWGKTFDGWQRIDRREVMMVKPLSFAPLLQVLFDATALRKIGIGKGFLFVCDDEAIEVKISKTGVKIAESDKSWRDSDSIVVKVSSRNLLEMIFSRANRYIALLTGRIKMRGIKNIPRVMKMFRVIRISQPWTKGIADSRI